MDNKSLIDGDLFYYIYAKYQTSKSVPDHTINTMLVMEDPTGNYYARRRMTMLFSMLDYLGIERGRTRVEWVSAAEGVKFSTTMNEFVEKIRSLGENVRLGDLRCKN